ncbi:MAG: FIVAR domain-containing protein, partial [Clostridiales Family XIII bacterium]|nr:FIVAR domain-containing protein [Clostridiales Family XIII bacterium]
MKKKTIARRLTAWLLALAMLLPGFGGASFAADASGGEIVLESGGVTLRTAAGGIPEDSVFTVTADKGVVSDYHFASYAGFAKGPDHIKAYTVSLKTPDGAYVTPTADVYMEFPIPEGWDADAMAAFKYSTVGRNASVFTDLFNDILTVDKAAGLLRATATKDVAQINASWLILDRGVAFDVWGAALADGLYHVGVTMEHNTYEGKMSMSNPAILGNTGYLEVTDGVPTLFFQTKSIENVGLVGYLGDLRVYTEASTKGPERAATVYAYHTDADGGFAADELAENHGLRYPKTLALTLPEALSSNAYLVHLFVPIMGVYGDQDPNGLSASVVARLRVQNPVPVEGPNPLAIRDKSALRAAIEDAEKSLDEDGAPSALAEAIDAARAVYDDDPTSAAVKDAIDALSAARAAEAETPPAVVKTALRAKLAAAEAAQAKYYTPESYAALQTVIEPARAVERDADATQAEVNAAVRALNAALEGLAGNGAETDKSALRAAIDEAEAIEKGDYTDKSYAAFLDALAAAKAVAADEAAGQIAIDAAEAGLLAAADALTDKLPGGLYEMTAGRVQSSSASPEQLPTFGSTEADPEEIRSITGRQRKPARVRILGDDMAVNAYIQRYEYKNKYNQWQEAWYTEFINFIYMEDIYIWNEWDDEGHVTEIAFTVPFTTEQLRFNAKSTQFVDEGYSQSVENICFDFDNAVRVEDEPLEEKLAFARSIETYDYTKASYAALQEAIAAAEAVALDANATEDARKAEADALDAAMGALKAEVADRAPVIALYEELKALDMSLYEGFYSLQVTAALSKASYILNILNATRKVQLDTATRHLSGILSRREANLIPPDKTALQFSIFTASDGWAASYYTEASHAALREALAAADAVYADPGATQSAIDEANANLQAAINALEELRPVGDGIWSVPVTGLTNAKNAAPGVLYGRGDAFTGAPAKVVVDGDAMTVTLSLRSYKDEGTSGPDLWFTELYGPSNDANIPVHTVLDDAGNIIEASFTIPYTITPIYIWGRFTGASRAYRVYVGLDFFQAEKIGDVDALEAAIAKAEKPEEADYTAESWAALQRALTTAKAVSAKADATREEIDTALADLTAALEALEEKPEDPPAQTVDTAELEARIADAEALDADDYTAETWTALRSALTDAKAVLDDAEATQDDVDAALADLKDALAALEEKPAAPVGDPYDVPAHIMALSSGTAFFADLDDALQGKPARVVLHEGNMTVTLYLRPFTLDKQTVWFTNLTNANSDSSVPVEKVFDADGRLTEATFTIPYTDARFRVTLSGTGNIATSAYKLLLFFDEAV